MYIPIFGDFRFLWNFSVQRPGERSLRIESCMLSPIWPVTKIWHKNCLVNDLNQRWEIPDESDHITSITSHGLALGPGWRRIVVGMQCEPGSIMCWLQFCIHNVSLDIHVGYMWLTSIYLSMSICVYTCVCIYIYIYTFILMLSCWSCPICWWFYVVAGLESQARPLMDP